MIYAMKKVTIPKRAAGVLMHVSSLPSPYGIGSFGKEARQWVDFLHEAGQSYWQVLPLGPTSYGDSPYQSFSAFAGNPYFIDLDSLCEDGLLNKKEYAFLSWGAKPGRVDYAALYENRETVLRKAHSRFIDSKDFRDFCLENAYWLESYSLYMSIKASQGQRSWIDWPEPLRLRSEPELSMAREHLKHDIHYHSFVQFLFFKQWNELRKYANDNKVEIIGDIPIYVSLDSADVWTNRSQFQLDLDGLPTDVAGCPPDKFAKQGQLWGNPLYDWKKMSRDGYQWWITRMKASFELYDVLRIDHFRGLESYYAIPYEDDTAENGIWLPGPGMDFIEAIYENVPQARIIAEDLGFLTDEVRKLVNDSGYPSMKVIQFAFDTRETSDYSPYNYKTNNIVYTGTHDNETVLGWAQTAPPKDIAHAMEYLDIENISQLPRAFIRMAMQNAAMLVVIPLQDWLELGSEARMNIPSTIGGINWQWRVEKSALTDKLAKEMAHICRLYGRLT